MYKPAKDNCVIFPLSIHENAEAGPRTMPFQITIHQHSTLRHQIDLGPYSIVKKSKINKILVHNLILNSQESRFFSLVTITNTLWEPIQPSVTDWTIHDSNPGRSKTIFLFLRNVQTRRNPTSHMFNGYRGSFSGWISRGFKLNTHLHVVTRLTMGGTIHLLPTYAFMALTETKWHFVTF